MFLYLSFYENTDQCVQLSNRILDYLRQKSATVGSLDFFQDSSLECFLTWAYTCPVSLVLGRWIHASSCCCGDVLFEQKPEKIVDQNSFNELEKRWPFSNTLCHSTTKKTPLATCSTFGHIIKDFAMQNHRRANLQEWKASTWCHDLLDQHASFRHFTYLYLILVLHTYLCMHGEYPWLNKHLWS